MSSTLEFIDTATMRKPAIMPPQPGGTYVMQGPVSDKVLDTYHLILAPTHACNLRCKHCYLPDHDTELLPREIALRLVDEWSEITLEERGPFRGIFHVKGGEPFIIPYLADIMDRLVQLQSLRLMLTTNGTFTSKEALDYLRICNDGLKRHVTVIVSLDGASTTTHNALRGPGKFEVTLSFLESLRDMGIHTFLNCVLYEGNLDEVPAYIQLAKDLHVSQINFLPLVPRGYGSALRCHQAPHIRLHHELQTVYENGDESTRNLLAGSLPHIIDRENNQNISAAHECVAAYRGLFYITPDGAVFTCPNLIGTDHSIGNVYTSSLHNLCDKLPCLYQRVREANSDDRALCTGERILYEKTHDSENLESLRSLQRSLSRRLQVNKAEPAMAYCISRNF